MDERTDGWMDGQMELINEESQDGWISGGEDEVDGSIDAHVLYVCMSDGWMDGWMVDGWMDGWLMSRWMDVWMDGRMDERMDG